MFTLLFFLIILCTFKLIIIDRRQNIEIAATKLRKYHHVTFGTFRIVSKMTGVVAFQKFRNVCESFIHLPYNRSSHFAVLISVDAIETSSMIFNSTVKDNILHSHRERRFGYYNNNNNNNVDVQTYLLSSLNLYSHSQVNSLRAHDGKYLYSIYTRAKITYHLWG